MLLQFPTTIIVIVIVVTTNLEIFYYSRFQEGVPIFQKMQKYGLEGKIIIFFEPSLSLSLFPPSIPKCYSYSCADYDCVWEERSPIVDQGFKVIIHVHFKNASIVDKRSRM